MVCPRKTLICSDMALCEKSSDVVEYISQTQMI